MRLIGGIAVFAICLLIGQSKAAELIIRQDIMHNFAQDLQALAVEMEYRPREIKNIAEKLCSGKLEDFWREFSMKIAECLSAEQAWEKAAKSYKGFEVLKTQELMLVIETGRSMGMLNGQDGIKILRYRSEMAEKYAEELKEQSKSKGTAYQKLGILGGLAMILLMV